MQHSKSTVFRPDAMLPAPDFILVTLLTPQTLVPVPDPTVSVVELEDVVCPWNTDGQRDFGQRGVPQPAQYPVAKSAHQPQPLRLGTMTVLEQVLVGGTPTSLKEVADNAVLVRICRFCAYHA
jgi:hypothetical protein